MINLILFIVMACYALYINYSWSKDYDEMNNIWAEYCNKLNDEWSDVYKKVMEEKK